MEEVILISMILYDHKIYIRLREIIIEIFHFYKLSNKEILGGKDFSSN